VPLRRQSVCTNAGSDRTHAKMGPKITLAATGGAASPEALHFALALLEIAAVHAEVAVRKTAESIKAPTQRQCGQRSNG
jgi:hypothetical protein